MEPHDSPQTEKTVYELFRASVLIKGAISLAEVIAGSILLLLPPSLVVMAIHALGNEAAETPLSGIVGTVITHLTDELGAFGAASILFVALYLLSRGLIKLGLVWGLLTNRLWAYPWSLAVLGVLVVYQAYQIATTHSLLVIGITVFDLFVLYFIWREYGIVRNHRANIA